MCCCLLIMRKLIGVLLLDWVINLLLGSKFKKSHFSRQIISLQDTIEILKEVLGLIIFFILKIIIMKKNINIVSLLCCGTYVLQAQNLIRNGGFEEYSQVPTGWSIFKGFVEVWTSRMENAACRAQLHCPSYKFFLNKH